MKKTERVGESPENNNVRLLVIGIVGIGPRSLEYTNLASGLNFLGFIPHSLFNIKRLKAAFFRRRVKFENSLFS